MFNLCGTAKLLRRLKVPPAALANTTTRLGDWYGNLFSVGRQQFSMFTSARSLLTVVLGVKDIHRLPNSLIEGLGCLLSELEVPRTLIDDELAQMQPFSIAATSSRSVLGSMNDFVFAIKYVLSEKPPRSLAEIHHILAETPMKSIGYRYPRELALDLLSGRGWAP